MSSEAHKRQQKGKPPTATEMVLRKPVVGPAGSRMEAEADRVAEEVVSKTEGNFASSSSCGAIGDSDHQGKEAPASVRETLSAPGTPLEPSLRDEMEGRFGHDFSRVRIHSGGSAARSAREVSSNAYTVGEDVVFGQGRFAPATSAGRRLLAHELTHVVQQSRGAGEAGASGSAAPSPLLQRDAADNASTFSDDYHYEEGLEESTIRVKPGPVRTTLIRPRVERMTNLRGEIFTMQDKPNTEPGAWIQNFLSFFSLWTGPSLGATPRYVFQQASRQRLMTFTEVVDTVMQEGALDGQTLDRNQVISSIVVHLPTVPKVRENLVSFYLTFSAVKTAHVNVTSGKSIPPDPLGGQAAAQLTLELHKEGAGGAELSWVCQLSSFRDTGGPDNKQQGPFKVQNVLTGFQAAWVFPFLNGALQISPIAQALMGVSRAEQRADGFVKMVPTLQVGAGGQIVYSIVGDDKGFQLQIGGQAAAAFTSPRGGYSTVDLAPSIFLQLKFP